MDRLSTDEELRQHLNQETGKLEWQNLAPHFARGVVIAVDPMLDLVEVGLCLIKDNKPLLEEWLAKGLVKRATDDEARDWTEKDPVFWAVVAAPWVVVQEVVEN